VGDGVGAAVSALGLRLNPDLDVEALAAAYARDSFVRIENIFPSDVAERLYEVLSRRTPWRFVYADPARGGAVVMTEAELAALGPQRQAALQQAILTRARGNVGYAYCAYPMIHALLQGWDPGHPLHQVTEFLQTPAFREFGRRVIGCPRVTKVDAQATLFRPGQFLTRHQDVGERQERRAAYTLSFSRGWQPDWGGLLAFISDDLNVDRAWTPGFNVLTLFDGLRTHAVTCVSPFAGDGRYSIVGWLRDDPAPLRQAV